MMGALTPRSPPPQAGEGVSHAGAILERRPLRGPVDRAVPTIRPPRERPLPRGASPAKAGWIRRCSPGIHPEGERRRVLSAEALPRPAAR
ncbi:MAG: hypothetical protein JWM27_2418 [Gemmatimonadetes bacterium]|nr:hypothetical protein [Gemmatimonadota bacterium]